MSTSIPDVALKPRDYQVDAFKWAISRKRAVVVLPTGTGKTLIAVLWMKRLLEDRKVKRVLVLEPTRFLVEQVARYISRVGNLDARPVHGAKSRSERVRCWREAQVVVATPEIVVADRDEVERASFDAVVVDECHHTTGKDSYVEAMKILSSAEYRLGLSAFIPRSRAHEIESLIGEIRVWSWEDPRVKPFIPPWVAEVYEAELNEQEWALLRALEEIRDRYSGRIKGLVQNAIRWLVRDGAIALRDSLQRATLLSKVLEPLRPLIEDARVRPAHKLDPLLRSLRDHEGFRKAIVFVDRVAVALYLRDRLSELGYKVALIRGRMRADELKRVLEEASQSAEIIVSTSAGEEGVDLPEADLLVLWSILASPLKFIQRHGRILRASTLPQGQKFVVYLVTVDTIDVDSLVDALEMARRIGVDVPIDRETIERLWRRTTRATILHYLEGNPMTIDWLAELCGWPIKELEEALRRLCKSGHVLYIHTDIGKVYALPEDIDILIERFQDYLNPDPNLEAKAKYRPLGHKSFSRAITGRFDKVLNALSKVLEQRGAIEELRISASIEVSKGLIKIVNLAYTFLIDNEQKLEIALRNAYSCRRFAKYVATGI